MKENLDKCLEYAQKVNKEICELGVETQVMRDCRDKFYREVKSPEMKCVMYELTVLETMLNEVMTRLGTLIGEEIYRERFILEDGGKTYLMDFEPGYGIKKEIVKMTKEEYKEYINRRASRQVYELSGEDKS